MKSRLYSFTPAGYISPLQCGLQTGHAIGELATMYNGTKQTADAAYDEVYGLNHYPYSEMHPGDKFALWVNYDKVIVILDAFNHRGVLNARDFFTPFTELFGLPSASFSEDEDSLNNVTTAYVIVVPETLYNVKFERPREYGGTVPRYVYSDANGNAKYYYADTDEFNFISKLKSYKTA